MASRPRLRALAHGLLPVETGHLARGAAPPAVPADAIVAFHVRVLRALEATRRRGFERGFLAYAPDDPGAPLLPEADAEGSAEEIVWGWEHPEATVAFSFHTHPGDHGLCVPSGIDLVGALIRGDHVVYVLTMDGRLSGWRFRDAATHPRAVDRMLKALDGARKLDKPMVAFLYDAFDAMRGDLIEPVFAARVDHAGIHPEPLASFFPRGEWR